MSKQRQKRESYFSYFISNCVHASPYKRLYIVLNCNLLFNAGVCKTEEDDGSSTDKELQCSYGEGVCKWFNVRMGFGFLSMTNREGLPLDEPVDVFVHQVRYQKDTKVLSSIDKTKHLQTPKSNT